MDLAGHHHAARFLDRRIEALAQEKARGCLENGEHHCKEGRRKHAELDGGGAAFVFEHVPFAYACHGTETSSCFRSPCPNWDTGLLNVWNVLRAPL